MKRIICAAAIAAILTGPAAAQEMTGWPREFEGDNGHRVLVFQPQIEEWEDFQRVEMRLAMALLTAGSDQPVFGTAHVRARTETNLEERTVLVFEHELVEASFPSVGTDSSAVLVELARSALPEASRMHDLDRVLAAMENPVIDEGAATDLGAEPPEVFVSEGVARLLVFDGEPIMSPIEDTNLLYALNTNWDVFLEAGESSYFLRDEDVWLMAEDFRGPWGRASFLPRDLRLLPDDENWRDAKASLPGRWVTEDQLPQVFVSTGSAELIAFEGPPELTPIPGTDLLWASNAQQDVFFHSSESRYFYLVTGRWFSAASLEGEWTAVAELPEDFAAIPSDHEQAHVRAAIPGTQEATEAVLLAQIPQKATVQRDSLQVEVEYAGDPEFREIDGSEVAYAVNTASDVMRVRGVYYLCDKGIWFVANTAMGPWTVTDSVPTDIYSIPSSAPVYHVTYVDVYESTPSTVTFGYTYGYMGMYVWGGAVVWGTGWYYDPWYWYGPTPYPYYYRYPYTYGAAAWYNPYTGYYGRGVRGYGPYGGVGAGARYNPRTGTYARGAGAWGAYGGTGYAEAFNPRTGTYGATRQSRSPYAQWGSSVVTRGDDWVRSQHYTDSRGRVGTIRRSDGAGGARVITDRGSGFVGRGADGDIYAGRDGNVYRRSGDSWQRRQNGEWAGAERSGQLQRPDVDRNRPGTYEGLQRDLNSRSRGDSNVRSRGSSRARGGRAGGRRRR